MSDVLSLVRKVRIHPLFWLTIGIGLLTAHINELLMLFVLVFIHEIGHVSAAHYFGWRIRKIEMLPFGGVAEMDEHGNRPLHEEIIVLLAGPAQHIWVMALSVFLFKGGFINEGAYEFMISNNLSLLLFNLLPIWPLDGGKLLFSFVSFFQPFRVAHHIMFLSSIVSFIAFIVLWLTINPTNLTIWTTFVFLCVSLWLEWKQRNYLFIRFLLERYYGKEYKIRKVKPIIVMEHEKIFKVFKKFQRGYKHRIVVQQKNGQHIFDESELLYAYFSQKLVTSSVGELIKIS